MKARRHDFRLGLPLSWFALLLLTSLAVGLLATSGLPLWVAMILLVLLPWGFLNRSALFGQGSDELWVSLHFWEWFKFFALFIGEFLKSNWRLAVLILRPQSPPVSGWIEVPCHIESRLGVVLIANFISLTPGTVSSQIVPLKRRGHYRLLIHCLELNGSQSSTEVLVERLQPLLARLTIAPQRTVEVEL